MKSLENPEAKRSNAIIGPTGMLFQETEGFYSPVQPILPDLVNIGAQAAKDGKRTVAATLLSVIIAGCAVTPPPTENPTQTPETPVVTLAPTPSASPTPELTPSPTAEATASPTIEPTAEPTPSYPEAEQNWVDNVTQPEIRWDWGNGPEFFGLNRTVEQDPKNPLYQGVLLDAIKLGDNNVIAIVGMEDNSGNRFFVPFRLLVPDLPFFSIIKVDKDGRGETGIPERMTIEEYYNRFGNEFKARVVYFSHRISDETGYNDPLSVARRNSQESEKALFAFLTQIKDGNYLTLPENEIPSFINRIPNSVNSLPLVESFKTF